MFFSVITKNLLFKDEKFQWYWEVHWNIWFLCGGGGEGGGGVIKNNI